MFAIFSLSFVSCSDDEGFRMPDEDEILTEHIVMEKSEDYVKYIDKDKWGQCISLEKDTFEIASYIKKEQVWEVTLFDKKFNDFRTYGDIITFSFGFSEKQKLEEYDKKNTLLVVSGNYKYMYTFLPRPRQRGLIYTAWDLSNATLEEVVEE